MIVERHLPHGAPKQKPRRIIVHAMAESIDWEGERLPAAEFLDRIGLSAHALIASDGSVIRLREDDEGAFHAKGFNTDSLGVEVLVHGVHDYSGFRQRIVEPWVRDRQLSALIDLVRAWNHAWGIGTEPGQLDRHSDVDPDRKADPGTGFPWERFLVRVRSG